MQSLYVLVGLDWAEPKGLDWAEPMMYLLCMSHVLALTMHLYIFSHILTCVNYFRAFLIVSFFPFSIFGYVSSVYGT